MAENGKLTITLHKSELVYDVKNKTYLTGRSRMNGGNYEQVANMQVSEDEENINQVLRSIGSAYSVLKTKLSEYVEVSATSASDILEDSTTDIKIELTVPFNFNKAVLDTLANACHQYIVNIALGEWFNITNKADAPEYFTMAGTCLELIRESLNKRVRPTRTQPTA